MQNGRLKVLGVLFALTVAFGIGLYSGVTERLINASGTASGTPGFTIDLNGTSAADSTHPSVAEFWKAWDILNENFVQTHASTSIPTDQEKIYGAIKGLTDSYGDPYTVFFPPVQAQIFTEDISGEFGGVGMEMDLNKGGELIVVAPLKDSPAEAAGIKSGDVVLAVNGTSTVGMTVEKAVTLIRGPKGTKVTLTIRRDGEAKPFEVSVVRDTIQIPEIKTYKRSDNIFVIQLYTFSANSAELFRGALREFMMSGSTKLIFDLRGNPGGYLDAAVQMASYFLPVGDSVVTEDFKGKQENQVHRSLGYNVFAGRTLSMAILVDRGSASASEILAGALGQHGVAKLVGTRTFGKGSVQQLIDIDGGAQLKVTIARWLTPNGSSISDGGIIPDIAADITAEDVKAGKDPQMDAAAKYLLAH
jgi:carboxyl-terminal processing protease